MEKTVKIERERNQLQDTLTSFDGPIARCVLIGLKRETVLTIVGACYDYWIHCSQTSNTRQ